MILKPEKIRLNMYRRRASVPTPIRQLLIFFHLSVIHVYILLYIYTSL